MISASKQFLSSKVLLFVLLALCLTSAAWAGQWTALGPDGGDVRSLAYDPQNPDHIFLGTSTGTLFSSTDGGKSWARFAHLGSGDDYVIDHLAIDPQSPNKMYAAAWSVETQQAGDLFHSEDAGKTWETMPAMHGKSIRAMAISASDSKTLVAGAVDGVFRSSDGGNSWQKISAGNSDIHSIESIAIDPKNPNAIYAGTWHLAWKTDDGGASWHHISKGMIEDSDVFSIIVDSTNPSVVFASACSGIYKSQSAGESFQKIQGIPFSARRTRVLKQDPTNPAIVYAGTTEGLWKTVDAGKTWNRVTDSDVVVNDVMIDPRNSMRVMLATDRAGVLASNDGAHSFLASNHGYAHRYVTAILADKNDPNTMYVGVVNDRELGGVFVSRDAGQHWTQNSKGLDGRDVFTLKQTSNGELVAGTNRGMFIQAHHSNEWSPINDVVNRAFSHTARTKTEVHSILTARVSDVEITPTTWLAATSAGLFTSSNQGRSWTGGAVLGKLDFVSVRADGNLIALATRSDVLVSKDNGSTWQDSSLSASISGIRGVTISDGQIMFASREGAFRSPNAGAGWEHMQNGLPDKNISSISYDQNNKRLLATSTETGVVFESQDSGRTWTRGPDTGFPLRNISVVQGRLLAATPFDGVVMQPDNEDHSASNGAETRRTN
ncbi:MAG: transcriptional regulator [Terriglobales bacterium]